jgi:NTP pyrophosphatase (non-canonical NTP hydrolase)
MLKLEFSEEQLKIIDHLVVNNGEKYNLHKASEECQELGLVLNQFLLKPTKVDKQEIIDEIGDVMIRLEILKRMFSNDAIQMRIDYKLSRVREWIDHKSYSQI